MKKKKIRQKNKKKKMKIILKMMIMMMILKMIIMIYKKNCDYFINIIYNHDMSGFTQYNRKYINANNEINKKTRK